MSASSPASFFQLRRLQEVRKYVNQKVLKQLVHAFIISRLDYCNCILAAARFHITSALQQLHWLSIHYRIQYKLCLLMYSVCQQHCPVYISNMVQSESVANSTHCQGLRSSMCPTFVVPRTCTKLGERAFSVCPPVAWNALPVTIFVILRTQNYLS